MTKHTTEIFNYNRIVTLALAGLLVILTSLFTNEAPTNTDSVALANPAGDDRSLQAAVDIYSAFSHAPDGFTSRRDIIRKVRGMRPRSAGKLLVA